VGDSSKPIDEREAKLKAVREAAEYSFPTADIAQMLEEIEREIVQAGTNAAPLPAAELSGLKETPRRQD
jgi:hypothetical protein